MGRLPTGLVAAFALLASGALAAGYKPPRTASGVPDLQGTWTNVSMTMLQRPKAFETLVISQTQAAAYEKVKTDRHEEEIAPLAPETPAPPVVDEVGLEAAQWYLPPAGLARIDGQVRTSWLVDPADGRLPYTEAARADAKATQHADEHVFDNPETRPFDERCLLGLGGTAGPPFLNTASNSHLQIVQTREHVVILAEMNHDARVVRLGDRRHLPPHVQPWMGDSVGWWEGDTLVVETTNFNPGERWRWNSGYVLVSEHAKVVERFTRTGPQEILYRFRVEDPNYTQAWRGEMPLKAAAGPIYEYACHEGNYALGNILAGARTAERAAAAN